METVTEVRVIGPYSLEVVFSDGIHRIVDLERELYGEVFEPLRDPGFFAKASLDPDIGTVVWPNGADFSPEFLYQAARTSTPRRPRGVRKLPAKTVSE